MAKRERSSTRDPQKELFWRGKLASWKDSRLSQAKFCRQEALNQNTFSSWKTILAERDAEFPKRVPHAARTKISGRPRVSSIKPSFVRLEVGTGEADTTAESQNFRGQGECAADRVLAAELVAPKSGCRVRIFNGADHTTLSALVVALAIC